MRHKLIVRKPVQIGDKPIVRQNPQLARRESHGEEITALASKIHLLGVARGRRAAMMSIGDVRNWYASEKLNQFVGHATAGRPDFPHGVAYAIARRKIVKRFAAAGNGHKFVNRAVVAIGKESRPRMCLKHLNMTGAIVFLVFTRALVLLNNSAKIVFGVERSDNARLAVSTHRLTISVELALAVTNKPTGRDHRIKRLARLRIGLWRSAFRPFRKINFRTRNMEKTLGIVGAKILGLGRIHHIIGNRRHFRSVGHTRPYGQKRTYIHFKCGIVRSRCSARGRTVVRPRESH